MFISLFLPALIAQMCSCPCDAGVSQDASQTTDASTSADSGVPDIGSEFQGCGRIAQTGVYGNTNLQARSSVGSSTYIRRSYTISVPTNYNREQQYPLVIGFHGSGWQGSSVRTSDPDVEFQSQTPAIYVYPDGLNTSWDFDPNGRDVAFWDTLLPHLRNNYCVDPSRIYIWGRSLGGGMVDTLASVRSSNFTALGIIVGASNTRTPASHKPLYVDGNTTDNVVGQTYLTFKNMFGQVNGCSNLSQVPTPPAGSIGCIDYACSLDRVQMCVFNSSPYSVHWPSTGVGQRLARFFGLRQ